MLRFRSISKSSVNFRVKDDNCASQVTYSPSSPLRKRQRNPYSPPLPLIILVVWCIFRSAWNFRNLLSRNLGLYDNRGKSVIPLSSSLRGTNKDSFVSIHNNSTTSCPALPDRLLNHHVQLLLSPPLVPLTKDDVNRQLRLMIKNRIGTMGDVILTCPDHHRSRLDPYGRLRAANPDECRGVVKQYRSRSVYQHVQRCLKILQHTGIVPRILYSDDETLTIVEEDKGFLTMRNSPIPVDFDIQLRRILCLLREHTIVHRDLTYPNFVIDEVTGMIYLIDMGDAFVWGESEGRWISNTANYNWRNLENLFNIWWTHYDEQERLETFIEATIPEITGDRQWRPPARPWTSLQQNKMGSLLLSKELVK